MKNIRVLTLLMLVGALGAQAPQSGRVEVRDQGTAAAQLENHSGKAVVGYVLVTEYKSPHATRPIKLVTKGICLEPRPDGAVWDQHFKPLSDPSFAPSTSLDYVIFDDGSSLGADSAKASRQLLSMRAGVNRERDRLRLLHASGGPEVVATDLGRPLSLLNNSSKPSAEDQELWNGMNMEHARLQRLYQKDGDAAFVAAVEKHL